jgi:hypothetical protein
MNRQSKRIVISTIYGVIFLVFIGLIVSLIMPDPTCYDGKQNQEEAGIDCGGPCVPCETTVTGNDLVVKDTSVVYGGEGKYDIVANIHNPNALFGGEKVNYTIVLFDENGTELDVRTGETFILPNENKYIVELELMSDVQPSKVETTIEKVDWVKFTDFDSPQIVIKNQKVGLDENEAIYAKAFGLVSNDSPYDFHNVVINIIILDERGVPIAAQKTIQKTLDSGDQREFTSLWPHEFPGNIDTAIMRPETNVFDSLNFMKKYLPGGKYQELTTEGE